jgi:1-pyrroline-5-carboxylate dehydrogenase
VSHHHQPFTLSPVLPHTDTSPEKGRMKHALEHLLVKVQTPVPLVINGAEVRPQRTAEQRAAHRHAQLLGSVEQASTVELNAALDGAARVAPAWAALSFEQRAAVAHRAADLLRENWRATVGAAAMVGLGRTVMEAEHDAGADLQDTLRHLAEQACALGHGYQPVTSTTHAHSTQFHAHAGVVLAWTGASSLTRAVAGVMAPLLAGAAVVWKPAQRAGWMGHFVWRVLREAGVPAGVLQYLPGPGATLLPAALQHDAVTGISFVGRPATFSAVTRAVGEALPAHKRWPVITADLGGGGTMVALPDTDVMTLAAASVRGAFGDAGQRPNAISRLYLAASIHDLWRPTVMRLLREQRVGNIEDFTTSMGPVMDASTAERLKVLFDETRGNPACKIIFGGRVDTTKAYVVEPTVVLTTDATSPVFARDPGGPVLAVHVFPDDALPDVLKRLRQQGGSTLSIFGRERAGISLVEQGTAGAFGTTWINGVPDSAAGRPWHRGVPGVVAPDVSAFARATSRLETYDPPYHHALPAMGAP